VELSCAGREGQRHRVLGELLQPLATPSGAATDRGMTARRALRDDRDLTWMAYWVSQP
jgi:hypothetical protein